ncbi:flagellar basal-body rod protein FlgF [Planococcus maritimus]|uniref:flagellar basal-body rod protein FlgF n=1 Tax=Planococcus maritimus TaxID=192421 RepID=UPI00080F30FB|nr:flagellar basal-body rod protein FlgF [Planococcus maritimus]ANU15926.1 flagellar basal-body rod protein FlgF [Planococcus maritimus]
MLRSMYSGVAGMKNFQVKLDVIGNNISNVNTIGFKKSSIQFQDLLSQTVSTSGANPMQVGLGSSAASLNINHSPGSAISTGVATDLSIMGDGFFVVQSPEDVNERYLTRAGSFTLDSDGLLTTAQGYNVLDTDGNPIQINPGSNFSIDRLGNIQQENGPTIQIGMFDIDNPASLEKVGGSMYKLGNQEAIANGDISDAGTINSQIGSGLLEMSNVDLTEEFTEMIIAQRGFQANSRTITTSDELLQEVVNLKR